jgi:hypothetical protein
MNANQELGTIFGIAFGFSLMILFMFTVIFQQYDIIMSPLLPSGFFISIVIGIIVMDIFRKYSDQVNTSFIKKFDYTLANGLIVGFVMSFFYVIIFRISPVGPKGSFSGAIINKILYFSVLSLVIIFTTVYSFMLTSVVMDRKE